MVRSSMSVTRNTKEHNDEHFKIKWGTLNNISSDIIKEDDERQNMVRSLKERGKEHKSRVRNINKHGEEP
jgi:hypothetical protein